MKHSLKEAKVLYQSLLFITLYIVVAPKLDNNHTVKMLHKFLYEAFLVVYSIQFSSL